MSLSHHAHAKTSPSVSLRLFCSSQATKLPDKPPTPHHPTPYPNPASLGCTPKCEPAPEVRSRQGWQHGTTEVPVKTDRGVLIQPQTHLQTPPPLLPPPSPELAGTCVPPGDHAAVLVAAHPSRALLQRRSVAKPVEAGSLASVCALSTGASF